MREASKAEESWQTIGCMYLRSVVDKLRGNVTRAESLIKNVNSGVDLSGVRSTCTVGTEVWYRRNLGLALKQLFTDYGRRGSSSVRYQQAKARRSRT